MYKVLDKGYVRLVNNMGRDIDVVNAARASFDKEVQSLNLNDEKLIRFLIEHRHDSVLRHCTMTFEVYAPLMVARQWWKHVVNSAALEDSTGWNESSRRYVTENEEFYVPSVSDWRLAAQDRKQGSSGLADPQIGAKYTLALGRMVEQGLMLYKQALAEGIAPEQARLLMPAYGMYVRWRWTASLNAVLNFLSLRMGHGAQSEIAEYAEGVASYVENLYPITHMYWMTYRVD